MSDLIGIIEDNELVIQVNIMEGGPQGIKGVDGYTPIKNVDYFDGANGQDGYTPIKNIDYFDGQNGASGVDGQNGYTPIKGVDYFDGGIGEQGLPGNDGYTPIKNIDYFDGVQGLPGVNGSDATVIISNTLTETVEGKVLDATQGKALKDEVTTFKENLASQSVGKGASLIGIHDVATLFTATNVEGALSELFTFGNSGKNLLETTLIAKNAEVSKIGNVATFEELNTAINELPSLTKVEYVYNLGNECIDITGGWMQGAKTSNGIYTEALDHIQLSFSPLLANSYVIGVTTNTVNFTNYTKLKMLFSFDTSGTTQDHAIIALACSNVRGSEHDTIANVVNTIERTDYTLELNTTAITGNYYIKVRVWRESQRTASATIKKIWFE